MSRGLLEAELRARGAKIVKTVSKNTDLLIAGQNASQPKLDKAQELGIPILYLEEQK